MSLRPDDHSSRTRSRSRTRDRSRSRSHVRVDRDTSPPAATLKARYTYPVSSAPAASMPVMPTSSSAMDYPPYRSQTQYVPTSGPYSAGLPYPQDGGIPDLSQHSNIEMGGYTDFPPHLRPGHQSKANDSDDDLAYGAMPGAPPTRKHSNQFRDQGSDRSASFAYHTSPGAVDATQSSQYHGSYPYAQQQPYQYAQPPETTTYNSQPHVSSGNLPVSASYAGTTQTRPRTVSQGQFSTAPSCQPHVVEVTPGVSKQPTLGLTPHMRHLSVSGLRPEVSGALPPPSPLLEPYHGTYQSISPMPSPMMLPHDGSVEDLPALSPVLSSDHGSSHGHSRSKSGSGKYERGQYPSYREEEREPRRDSVKDKQKGKEKKTKRVTVYDAEKDAIAINDALSHHTRIDADLIIDILPGLSHDQILELRKEYKKHATVGGRGINIAKHIKVKLSGNFGKVAYVCALGRWESEGYWANFWYQSHGSRRELLIESLMGRQNAEIRQIKESFKDKRYGDDLVKCVEKELKPDKFRAAVLMALDARRQEESEVYPREYVDKDVSILHSCLSRREGGETAMLEIVVRRSDAHLRETLNTYERAYGSNFAKEALKKSQNLIGEVIAHVLNGVINRPARDALLLHHAINDIAAKNRDDELRYELLISRLVRVHWDRMHLARVKRAYEDRYHRRLEEDIEGATKGDFREFLCEMCQ